MFKNLWPFNKRAKQVELAADQARGQQELPAYDPLDPVSRQTPSEGWTGKDATPKGFDIELISHEAYPTHVPRGAAMDNADSGGSVKAANGGVRNYQVPDSLQAWYASQGFIGYQSCAIIAQHWLVDKACSMVGEDAIRNGWELKTDGNDLSDEQLSAMREFDTEINLKQNLEEFNRFKNIFGIRVAIFKVDSDDPDYYEKPFNIDGITEGSYQGISQVDPYWMTPQMTSAATNDPSAIHFYDPEFWVISGKKYHRSHLIIARGPQPADILKPTYIFGGIPLTQRIYERVYAAERTANEAPLLALNKRTTAIHVDLAKAMTNESTFVEKLLFWVKYRDNHAVKVLGKDETMEQFDTNLADFDSVIMNQYQLVSAIAKTPATKLLGTSPKGFNATGEFEMVSYHEELESTQEHVYDPLLERHYAITLKSMGLDIQVTVIWNPVDSITTKERADLNDKKADTDQKNIAMGAVSPDEVRQRLRDDKHSGYNRLTDDEANDEPGMSPENIAAFEKAGAQNEQGQARGVLAEAQAQALGTEPQNATPTPRVDPKTVPEVAQQVKQPAIPTDKSAMESQRAKITELLMALNQQLTLIDHHLMKEGVDLAKDTTPGIKRSVQPSVGGISPTVAGTGAVVPTKDDHELPGIKVGGMIMKVENPRGSIRVSKSGKWKVKMPHHYGYVHGTTGADGDEVDCFIGPNLKSPHVYVINQTKQDGTFDEHKCMVGFDSPVQAKKGYMDSYSKGWTGFGSMQKMTMDDFKAWVNSKDTSKPLGKI